MVKLILFNIIKKITIFIMVVFYINVGILHFIDPDWFLTIVPPYLPFHLELVYISGFFEILFGVLLIFQNTRSFAAKGLMLLLIVVFPANIYLAQTNGAVMNITPLIAWGRLPIQFIFIGLAYWYSLDK